MIVGGVACLVQNAEGGGSAGWLAHWAAVRDARPVLQGAPPGHGLHRGRRPARAGGGPAAPSHAQGAHPRRQVRRILSQAPIAIDRWQCKR